MGKSKYNKKWQDNRPWLQAVKNDIYSALCTACNCSFSVSGSGVAQVSSHENRDKHKKALEIFHSQRTLTNDDHSLVLSSNLQLSLTLEEKVKTAEIIQVLNIIDNNQAFSSANSDNKRFQQMFPDSNIARSYKQGETKVKYVLQFGIAPYIRNSLIEEVKGQAFCFKFDETTTAQVKKQYDGYITYYSSSKKEIMTSYCGSLFLGHCKADDLVRHFFEFMGTMNLDVNILLNIGMDGPSVNKKFERNLLQSLEVNEGTRFICIGSCPLHIVNNSFGEGMGSLRAVINLDQFAIDLHFFFKYSAARREDFLQIRDITDVTVQYVLRHCQTRWLSIERVLVRIIEQYENLCTYFLTELPKQLCFKGKNGVGNTDRYKRISSNLNNKALLPYMAFIVYIAQDFRQFLLPLQTSAPMIHLLYSMERKLIQNLLSKFIQPDHFMRKEKSQLVSNKKILLLDVKNKENQLVCGVLHIYSSNNFFLCNHQCLF